MKQSASSYPTIHDDPTTIITKPTITTRTPTEHDTKNDQNTNKNQDPKARHTEASGSPGDHRFARSAAPQPGRKINSSGGAGC